MTRTLLAVRSAAIAALAGLFFLVSAAPSQAENRNVRIINETGSTMMEFYASNVGETSWEEDILGRDVLPAGDSINMNIDDGTGYCLYDFKAVFADGDVITKDDVDVCEIASFRFTSARSSRSPAPGRDFNRQVNIINETNTTMMEFYASNVNADTWEEDILGRDVLGAGDSVMMNIDDGSGYCLYDFKAVFSDGDVVTQDDINVCEISSHRYTSGRSTTQTRGLNRQVRIINETSWTMVEFYASNVDADTWEEDILGRDVLGAGDSVMMNIDDGTGYCMYDFRAVFADGDTLVRNRINVCEISSYRYHE